MWFLNAWQVAAFSTELGDGLLSRRLCDKPVVLYRLANGSAVALEDRCPHRLLPLSAGTRVGDDVQCGYHGMRFGPDGRCVLIPGQERIPPAAAARSFPLVERYGIAWIWLGEPSVANPDLVPDCHWMDHPDWVPSLGYTHFHANYRLVTDNLLDLSHESFIHQKTIGNQQEEAIAGFPVRVTQESGRLVRAHREMPSIMPPPQFQIMTNQTGRIDRWQSAVYMPPGIHMTDVGAYPVGTPREAAAMLRVLHLLTPETATSTHYFWAACRRFRVDEPEMTAFMREATRTTFDEDKHILELQERAIAENPGVQIPNVAIMLDAAPMQARRMLAKFIEQEQANPLAVAPPVIMAPDEALPLVPVAA